MDFSSLLGDVQLIVLLVLLESILSIDNVAVLAAMASHLPQAEIEPSGWNRLIPRRVRHDQQKAALEVGILGAYIGRGLMLAAAGWIILHPSLRYVGAFYLLLLAWNHFLPEKWQLDPLMPFKWIFNLLVPKRDEVDLAASKGFWATVVSIELADLAFSLDNVIAAVALSSHILIVFLGVFVGIAVMRFFAGKFIRVIEWEPALEHGAYLLIVSIGIKLVLEQVTGHSVPEFAQFFFSLGILVTVAAVAKGRKRVAMRRINGKTTTPVA